MRNQGQPVATIKHDFGKNYTNKSLFCDCRFLSRRPPSISSILVILSCRLLLENKYVSTKTGASLTNRLLLFINIINRALPGLPAFLLSATGSCPLRAPGFGQRKGVPSPNTSRPPLPPSNTAAPERQGSPFCGGSPPPANGSCQSAVAAATSRKADTAARASPPHAPLASTPPSRARSPGLAALTPSPARRRSISQPARRPHPPRTSPAPDANGRRRGSRGARRLGSLGCHSRAAPRPPLRRGWRCGASARGAVSGRGAAARRRSCAFCQEPSRQGGGCRARGGGVARAGPAESRPRRPRPGRPRSRASSRPGAPAPRSRAAPPGGRRPRQLGLRPPGRDPGAAPAPRKAPGARARGGRRAP